MLAFVHICLMVPLFRVFAQSRPLVLQLRDSSAATTTTPWAFQRFQSMVPVGEDCDEIATCKSYLHKHAVCANIAEVGREPRCCNDKKLITNASLSTQAEMDFKLGESVEQAEHPAATWSWPTQLETLVPDFVGTSTDVAGTTLIESEGGKESSLQQDGVGPAAKFATINFMDLSM